MKKLIAAAAFCFVVAACGQAPAEESPAPAAVVCEQSENVSALESDCTVPEKEVAEDVREKN